MQLDSVRHSFVTRPALTPTRSCFAGVCVAGPSATAREQLRHAGPPHLFVNRNGRAVVLSKRDNHWRQSEYL